MGCYGCKDIPTPHIDKLALDGVRFTSGYVTWHMCGPSRAGFITGRNQASFGYYKNQTSPLDPNQGLPKMETLVTLVAEKSLPHGSMDAGGGEKKTVRHPKKWG